MLNYSEYIGSDTHYIDFLQAAELKLKCLVKRHEAVISLMLLPGRLLMAQFHDGRGGERGVAKKNSIERLQLYSSQHIICADCLFCDMQGYTFHIVQYLYAFLYTFNVIIDRIVMFWHRTILYGTILQPTD